MMRREPRCTQHNDFRNGRCATCQRERNRAWAAKQRADARAFRQIKDMLAV